MLTHHQIEHIKLHLGQMESANDYKARNPYGMIGKYQLSPPALQDIGLLDSGRNWTGFMGINSEEEFLNSPKAQEEAMDKWLRLLDTRISRAGLYNYVGKEISGGLKITQEGVVAAAHFAGVVGLKEWFEGKRVVEDANGSTPLIYLSMFDIDDEYVDKEYVEAEVEKEYIKEAHGIWKEFKQFIKGILRKILLWALRRLG
jgi:hypothetical protein